MAQSERRYTYEEYLAFDDANDGKHELVNGQIVAMAGGSPRHNALAFRLAGAIGSGLRSGCTGFQSDQRTRVIATGRTTYPDITIVYGDIERDPADKTGHTITNPTAIVEVLSPSTEKDDRGEKRHHYMRVPSLQEYILVSQDRPLIERYRRSDKGTWEFAEFSDGHVELASGGSIDVDKLYADLPANE